jgi:phosphatidylserine/phosphatidylglycerophosphate/cardiolipin synthase-like enzyme
MKMKSVAIGLTVTPRAAGPGLTTARVTGKPAGARLRPRPGRTLPKELHADQVARLVEVLPLGVRDAGFERLLSRIDTGPVHHGNQVQLLFRGEEAFASVCHAIVGATEEILLETYILRDDYVSIVGSSNLDFRSFYFNAECNVLIFDDATGQRMTQAFEEDLGQSVEMRQDTWNQRPLAHRLGDALARCLSPLL